jgi:hypothetical protein
MSQQDKQPGGTDAQHRGKTEEARPNEGGRSGGQQGGGQTDRSQQGARAPSRTSSGKAEKGEGNPA